VGASLGDAAVDASLHSWGAAASVVLGASQGIGAFAGALVPYQGEDDVDVQGPYHCFQAFVASAAQGPSQDEHQAFVDVVDLVPYLGDQRKEVW